MSELVSILEGQSSKQFNNVNYLRTSQQGGGYIDWTPENAVALTNKTVNRNGTYRAAEEEDAEGKYPYYGYGEFSVDVPKKDSVTGNTPDGNETNVTNNNGNLTETVLPSSIRITTYPSKMSYSDGESISLTGAIIKAYKNDGALWEGSGYSGGVIPNSEIQLTPTKADASQAGTDAGLHTVKYNGYNELTYAHVWSDGDFAFSSPSYVIRHGYTMVGLSQTPGFADSSFWIMWGSEGHFRSEQLRHYTYNGQQKQYYAAELGVVSTAFPEFVTSGNWMDIAAIILFEGYEGDNYGKQKIKASWNRPKDGKTLATSFSITVS